MLVNKEEKMVGGSEEGGTEVWRGMWRGRQVAIKQVGEEEVSMDRRMYGMKETYLQRFIKSNSHSLIVL